VVVVMLLILLFLFFNFAMSTYFEFTNIISKYELTNLRMCVFKNKLTPSLVNIANKYLNKYDISITLFDNVDKYFSIYNYCIDKQNNILNSKFYKDVF